MFKKQLRVLVTDATQLHNESSLQIHLLQPLCRSEKMDWCLQKATELGVNKITPIKSTRVNINIAKDRLQKKIHHWQAVIAAACEQSGRACIPRLHNPVNLQDLVSAKFDEQVKLVASPKSDNTFSTVNNQIPGSCACLIGPEGGFTANELALLENAEFRPIALGPRILRLETAVVASITLVQSTWGDLN